MSICPRCKAVFHCSVADDENLDGNQKAPCWCMQLPPLPAGAASATHSGPAHGAAACLCPSCLQALIGAGKDVAY